MYTIKWAGLQPTEAGWSPPPTPLSGFQPNNRSLKGNLEGQAPRTHLNTLVRQSPSPPPGRRCRCCGSGEGNRPVPQWQHWIVAVEPTGRITLPLGARGVLAHLDRSRDRLA